MARPLRCLIPDGVSHVFGRGIRREPIYTTELDGSAYLSRTAEAFRRFNVSCWAYCLMPNHYHFVLDGLQTDKSVALKWLNSAYAQWFNRKHGFRGHLFGDRHGARAVTNEAHALEVIRYVLLNPVRAGICRHPGAWRWSSYGATLGRRPSPEFLDLSWMDELIAPAAFEDYVESALLLEAPAPLPV